MAHYCLSHFVKIIYTAVFFIFIYDGWKDIQDNPRNAFRNKYSTWRILNTKNAGIMNYKIAFIEEV